MLCILPKSKVIRINITNSQIGEATVETVNCFCYFDSVIITKGGSAVGVAIIKAAPYLVLLRNYEYQPISAEILKSR